MKRLVFILLTFIVGGGFCVAAVAAVYAQEPSEEYLMTLQGANAESYITLMHEGSQEGKLVAAIRLGELGDGSPEVIEALVYGLGQGTFFVVRQYGKVTNDYWDVRAASAKSLGQISDPSSLKDLYYTLRYDPDKFVRGSAAYAIGKIGEKKSVYYLKRIIETSSTTGPDDDLILACVEALGDIGDQSAFTTLVEVVRGKHKRSLKLAAMESIRKLKF
ncbi:MAG: HEAT repeat domain-containing protein [Spirochaetes bacterium]|nr:HEAT repeat domain-containing protein [Spirochaetota bacterium]